MRASILALLAAPTLLLTGACALNRAPQPLDNNPRGEVVSISSAAQRIPLYAERGLPGCRYRRTRTLAAGTLMGLQDQAYQSQADAVVEVRQQMHAPRRPRSEDPASFQPAATLSYTGVAVRFDTPECRNRTAPQDGAAAAS